MQNNIQALNIHFTNIIDGRPIVLHDSNYVNPFGESYSISKLRYYISNIELHSATGASYIRSSYLVDEAKEASHVIRLRIKKSNYQTISFLFGVDSVHNVSGAQSGALDPMNDMFWTWNTGYVMAKFEGTSTASLLHNQVFEYHIGGFRGPNHVLHKVTLVLPENGKLKQVSSSKDIYIKADVNKWWYGSTDIKIASNPSVTTPGVLAKEISNNYSRMFSIDNSRD